MLPRRRRGEAQRHVKVCGKSAELAFWSWRWYTVVMQLRFPQIEGMLLRYIILSLSQELLLNIGAGFSIGQRDLWFTLTTFRKFRSYIWFWVWLNLCGRSDQLCSFLAVSQFCKCWKQWTLYTRLSTWLYVLRLSINKLNIRTATHMQTHFFSQAKTPAVYFVTETENHNANNMPHALVPTTCLIFDKGTDTQSLFPSILSFSFSYSLLASLALTLVKASSHSWCFWLFLKPDPFVWLK